MSRDAWIKAITDAWDRPAEEVEPLLRAATAELGLTLRELLDDVRAVRTGQPDA